MTVPEIVTNKIIDYLNKGKIPWQQPWVNIHPQNYTDKHEYSGINFFLLSIICEERKYKFPYFLTFNQIDNLGGYLKEGEGKNGCMIIYRGSFEVTKTNDKGKEETDAIPFIRYYKVFNIEQCEGIEMPKEVVHQPNKNYEEVLKTYKSPPKIENGDRAYYSPINDTVVLPVLNRFNNVKDYYSTLYHELTHSTGAESRLNRFIKGESTIFGSECYSREELIAELGSAFMCARYGIDNSQIKKSAGYLQSWLKVFQNDSKFIITASSKAQKAVNLMLNKEVKN